MAPFSKDNPSACGVISNGGQCIGVESEEHALLHLQKLAFFADSVETGLTGLTVGCVWQFFCKVYTEKLNG